MNWNKSTHSTQENYKKKQLEESEAFEFRQIKKHNFLLLEIISIHFA